MGQCTPPLPWHPEEAMLCQPRPHWPGRASPSFLSPASHMPVLEGEHLSRQTPSTGTAPPSWPRACEVERQERLKGPQGRPPVPLRTLIPGPRPALPAVPWPLRQHRNLPGCALLWPRWASRPSQLSAAPWRQDRSRTQSHHLFLHLVSCLACTPGPSPTDGSFRES